MSYNWNTRTELLFGAERMERLSRSHVLVVGLGGVGAYAAEQICRQKVPRESDPLENDIGKPVLFLF